MLERFQTSGRASARSDGDLEQVLGQLTKSMTMFQDSLKDADGKQFQETVKFKRACHHVMEAYGAVRILLEESLRKETGEKGRPKLTETFAGDGCAKIALIKAYTQFLLETSEGSQLSTDPRLLKTESASKAIENVLVDMGHAQTLKKASEEALAKVEEKAKPQELRKSLRKLGRDAAMLNLIQSHNDAKTDDAEPTTPLVTQQVSQDIMPEVIVKTGTRMAMVAQIDEMESAKAAAELIDHLFDIYDHDSSGELVDNEYDLAIKDLSEHVFKEASQRNEKFGWAPPQRDAIVNWVTQVVDPDFNGRISRAEAQIGFKKVVDDVD